MFEFLFEVVIRFVLTGLFGFFCGVLACCLCVLAGCEDSVTSVVSNSVWTVVWVVSSVVVLDVRS